MPLYIPKELVADLEQLRGDFLKLLPASAQPNTKGEIKLDDKNKDVEIVQRLYQVINFLLTEIENKRFKDAESFRKYLEDYVGWGKGGFVVAITVANNFTEIVPHYYVFKQYLPSLPIVGLLSYQAAVLSFELLHRLLIEKKYSFDSCEGSENALSYLTDYGIENAEKNEQWKSYLSIGETKVTNAFQRCQQLLSEILKKCPNIQTVQSLSTEVYARLELAKTQFNLWDTLYSRYEEKLNSVEKPEDFIDLKGHLFELINQIITPHIEALKSELAKASELPKVVLIFEGSTPHLFRPLESVHAVQAQSQAFLAKLTMLTVAADISAQLKQFDALAFEQDTYDHETYIKFSNALQSLGELKNLLLFKHVENLDGDLEKKIEEHKEIFLPQITAVEQKLTQALTAQKAVIFKRFQTQLAETVDGWKTALAEKNAILQEQLAQIDTAEQEALSEFSTIKQTAEVFLQRINVEQSLQDLLSSNHIPSDSTEGKNLLDEFKIQADYLLVKKMLDEAVAEFNTSLTGFSTKIDHRRLELSRNNANYIENLQKEISELEVFVEENKSKFDEAIYSEKIQSELFESKKNQTDSSEKEIKKLEDDLLIFKSHFDTCLEKLSNAHSSSKEKSSSIFDLFNSDKKLAEDEKLAELNESLVRADNEVQGKEAALQHKRMAFKSLVNDIEKTQKTMLLQQENTKAIHQILDKNQHALTSKQLELQYAQLNKSADEINSDLFMIKGNMDTFVMPDARFIADPQYSFSEQWSANFLARQRALTAAAAQLEGHRKTLVAIKQKIATAQEKIQVLHQSLEAAERQSIDVSKFRTLFEKMTRQIFPKIILEKKTLDAQWALLRMSRVRMNWQLTEEKKQADELIQTLSQVDQLAQKISALNSCVDTIDYSETIHKLSHGKLGNNYIADQDQFYIDAAKQILEFEEGIKKVSQFIVGDSSLEDSFSKELIKKCWQAQDDLNDLCKKLGAKRAMWKHLSAPDHADGKLIRDSRAVLNGTFSDTAVQNYENYDLRGIQLTNKTFAFSFRGANLENAILDSCNFSNSSLEGANLCGATLKAMTFASTNFKGVVLDARTQIDSPELANAILSSNLADPYFKPPSSTYFSDLVNSVDTQQPIQPKWILDILKAIAVVPCPNSGNPESHLIAQKNRAICVVQTLVPKLTTMNEVLALYELVEKKHQGDLNPYAFIRQERSWFRGKYGNTHTWEAVILPIKQKLKALHEENTATITLLDKNSQRNHLFQIMNTMESRSFGLFPYKSPISEGWEKSVDDAVASRTPQKAS